MDNLLQKFINLSDELKEQSLKSKYTKSVDDIEKYVLYIALSIGVTNDDIESAHNVLCTTNVNNAYVTIFEYRKLRNFIYECMDLVNDLFVIDCLIRHKTEIVSAEEEKSGDIITKNLDSEYTEYLKESFGKQIFDSLGRGIEQSLSNYKKDCIIEIIRKVFIIKNLLNITN